MSTIQHIGKDCCGCGACADICPQRCIQMLPNQEGFLYPMVDEKICVHCNRCESTCPVLNAGEGKTKDCQEAWAAVQRDSKVLLESSSGGLFTALAMKVLNEDGCVFGAAFTDDFRRVNHIMVDRAEKLSLLRGSKYLQSETGACYILVQELLKQGKPVLFTGTPCQIAGLKHFLGKEYENLYLVDIICHGVPSAVVWQHYLDQIMVKFRGKPTNVNFRKKKESWFRYGLEICFADGKCFFQQKDDNPYMKIFLRNECLRESCYHCVVKETGTVSDLTIGDFWGVERVIPEMESKMGISLVLVHTDKGRGLFYNLGSEINRHQVDYGRAISANSVLKQSVNRPAARDTFFADLTLLPWKKIQVKYAKEDLRRVIMRKLSNSVIGKIRRKLRRG